MIERVSTCLENGGLSILRIPKNRFKTRRSLHSAFWSHGAGDIDLPAWWLALLQVPAGRKDECPSKRSISLSGELPLDVSNVGLLDFLYPAQTFAFLRKRMSENATALREHRRCQRLMHRSRTYTSAVAAVSGRDGQPDQATETPDAIDASKSKSDDSLLELSESNLREKFHSLVFSRQSSGQIGQIEELWDVYQKFQSLSLSLYPAELAEFFKCLGTSPRVIDHKRTMKLFDNVPALERRAVHYTYAISAALMQDDLATAATMHREAALRIHGSFGSSKLIKHAVMKKRWDVALEVWLQYRNNMQSFFEDIWSEVDSIPLSHLMRQIPSAIDFAVQLTEASSFEGAAPARQFVKNLVWKALETRGTLFDLDAQFEIFLKVQKIHVPDIDLYRLAILQNLALGPNEREHSRAGLRIYRMLKRKPDIVPDLEILGAVLERFEAVRSLKGMYEVLEDYRKHHGAPPKGAYQRIMAELARQGDIDTVESLFREAILRHGKELVPKLANSILYACFRRADVHSAEKWFTTLEHQFGHSADVVSYNLIIATYARVEDFDGAQSWYNRLCAADASVNNSTYGVLMGMFAARGDWEATNGLYERSVTEGIQPSFEMMDSLVLAQIKNDRPAEARELVNKALTMDLEATWHQAPFLSGDFSRTRMWNTLITYHALRGEVNKVGQLQHLMHGNQVPFDGMTYAALMQCLCMRKLPNAAWKILRDMMPANGIRATALHYSIAMTGYVATRQYHRVFELSQLMLKRNIRPTFSTQNPLLQAAAGVDKTTCRTGPSDGMSFKATQAEAILEQTLESLDRTELAPSGPKPFKQSNPIDVAFTSSYFSYMVALYGRNRSFDKVKEMYDRSIMTNRKFSPHRETSQPIEMTSALMVAHIKAKDYHQTEQYWNLSLEESKKLACKAGADTSKPGWVLHSRRHILHAPLGYYMTALAATDRIDDLISVITSFRHAGFHLTNANWNVFVQILVQHGRTQLAYETSEEQLMHDWPGWNIFSSPMVAKYRFRRKVPSEPWKKVPQYETLVYLAGAYLEAQRMPYGRGREAVRQLNLAAPRTVQAVVNMPRYVDELQERILRSR